MRVKSNVSAVMLLGGLIAGTAQSGIVVPDGLNPGDTYHLVFVTNDEHDATSSNVADYNFFVQTQAEQNSLLTGTNVGVSWRAMVSTNTDIARFNAPIEAPVYLLDGTTLIATGFADMWDGRLLAPISLNQFVAPPTPRKVWTGSNSGGFPSSMHIGDSQIHYGSANTVSSRWMLDQFSAATDTRSFYALSEKLTVPFHPIHEPSNASFVGTSDLNTLDIDFGTVKAGANATPQNFDIWNIVLPGAASLNLDGITGIGDTSVLTTDLSIFSDLAPGSSRSFTCLFNTTTCGEFAASYALSFSDATGHSEVLTLNLHGNVIPEPSTLATMGGLLAMGLVGGWWRRRPKDRC